ncbi:Gag-Pol polyprotein [Bienertia sinuspersici]
MQKYLQQVKRETETLTYFSLTQIPRSDNNQVDALPKLASSALSDNPRIVFWEVREKKSIEENQVMVLDRSLTWMNSIWEYKTQGTLPSDPREANKLKRKAEWFEVFKGSLYKKSYSKPYLKCITPEKGQEVLDDLHRGLCSSHIGGRALAEKIMRLGYFWPTLRQDAMDMVMKCEKFQKIGPLIHRPATELTTIDSPLPFAKWGMDILGPYTLATGQRRYVFVIVDYFTKWLEADAVKGINTNVVILFIWKNVITQYGIPQSIVFDNGPQFETPHLKKWLFDQGVSSYFASVGRPQANGQAEAFNKIISEGVKKKLDKAKGLWADELSNVLWSVRTTAKNSTGETPFLLVYKAEAMLLIEMYEPTLRVMLYDEEANWEEIKLALDSYLKQGAMPNSGMKYTS